MRNKKLADLEKRVAQMEEFWARIFWPKRDAAPLPMTNPTKVKAGYIGKGLVIHVHGVPFELTSPARVKAHPNNFKTAFPGSTKS